MKSKTKQFNCLARLQEKGLCPLLCKHLHSFISLEHRKSEFLSSRLTLVGEWKTLSSPAQTARTATATPAPGPRFLVSHNLQPDKDPCSSQIKGQTRWYGKFSKQHSVTLAGFWLCDTQVLSYCHAWIMLSTTFCRGKNHKTEATAKLLTPAVAFQGASFPS